MKIVPTALPGVVLVEPTVHRDERGFFLETYHAGKFRQGGLDLNFVQDNHSRSIGPILRGLHTQLKRPQGKLVRCVEGEIFDVAVDARAGSPTFKQWVSASLSAGNFLQLYIPPGFLHGFVVTQGPAQVQYKCTELYDREDELGVAWDDPEIGIQWPVTAPILSPKDRKNPRLAEILASLPRYPNAAALASG